MRGDESTTADEIVERIATMPRLRLGIGTVTAVDDPARLVDLRTEWGTVMPDVRRVYGYAPTVGDVVGYLADPGGNWLVLG